MSNFFNSNVKSFVLRSGRVTTAQKRALRDYSGFFCVPFSNKELPPEKIFGNRNPIVLDIGFGMGHEIIDFSTKNTTKTCKLINKNFTSDKKQIVLPSENTCFEVSQEWGLWECMAAFREVLSHDNKWGASCSPRPPHLPASLGKEPRPLRPARAPARRQGPHTPRALSRPWS